jgi:hypothetical protein
MKRWNRVLLGLRVARLEAFDKCQFFLARQMPIGKGLRGCIVRRRSTAKWEPPERTRRPMCPAPLVPACTVHSTALLLQHCCMPSRDNCVKELLKDRAYIIRSMLRYVLRYAKANDLLAYAPIVKCGCAQCTGFLMLLNPFFSSENGAHCPLFFHYIYRIFVSTWKFRVSDSYIFFQWYGEYSILIKLNFSFPDMQYLWLHSSITVYIRPSPIISKENISARGWTSRGAAYVYIKRG